MTTDATDVEFPDVPAFRPGATRRAVWRGVARTSFLVVGWFIVITFIANIGGHVLMHVLGRQAHRRQAGERFVGVDVDDWHLEAFGQIAGVQG